MHIIKAPKSVPPRTLKFDQGLYTIWQGAKHTGAQEKSHRNFELTTTACRFLDKFQ